MSSYYGLGTGVQQWAKDTQPLPHRPTWSWREVTDIPTDPLHDGWVVMTGKETGGQDGDPEQRGGSGVWD